MFSPSALVISFAPTVTAPGNEASRKKKTSRGKSLRIWQKPLPTFVVVKLELPPSASVVKNFISSRSTSHFVVRSIEARRPQRSDLSDAALSRADDEEVFLIIPKTTQSSVPNSKEGFDGFLTIVAYFFC